MTRRHVTVALVVLVLSSGCSGVLGGESGTRELDPADADLPPGVTETGLQNASALVAAHHETRLAEGFRLNGTQTENPERMGKETVHATVVAGADGGPSLHTIVSRSYESDDSTVATRYTKSIWGNGTAVIRRIVDDGETHVRASDTGPRGIHLTGRSEYESYLDAGNFTVESVVARGDHTFTTLATNETRTVDGTAMQYRAQFVVDERGVVHEAVVDLPIDGGRTDRHTEYDLVELGTEAPERPTWVTNGRDTNE